MFILVVEPKTWIFIQYFIENLSNEEKKRQVIKKKIKEKYKNKELAPLSILITFCSPLTFLPPAHP